MQDGAVDRGESANDVWQQVVMNRLYQFRNYTSVPKLPFLAQHHSHHTDKVCETVIVGKQIRNVGCAKIGFHTGNLPGHVKRILLQLLQ